MQAFLRFRRLNTPEGEHFVAWFEPEHHILEAAAGFFVERFASMRWSILTPIGSMHWNRAQIAFGPSARREDAPGSDAFEAGWRGYYESAFNPRASIRRPPAPRCRRNTGATCPRPPRSPN